MNSTFHTPAGGQSRINANSPVIGDPADSPRASHRDLPSDHCDSLRDFIIERFLLYGGPLPSDRDKFRHLSREIVDLGIRDASEAGVTDAAPAGSMDVKTALVRVLQMLSGDRDHRLAVKAICYLRLLGLESRSFAEIGAPFGLCRAAVQTVYRGIQRSHPGMRGRADKSDGSREACRRRRLGVRKSHFDWIGGKLWQRPKCLSRLP